MSRPARRQREIEHTKEDILHAAARALGRLGSENTTIHDIASEAGYTATSLYSYFGGKQEIVDTLVAKMLDEVKGAYEAEPPPGLGFPQRLEFLFGRLAELSDRWGEARMILFETKARGEVAERSHVPSARDATFIGMLTAWIRKNASGPEDFGGADPEEIAFIVRGILHGAALLGQRDRFRSTAGHRFGLALRVCLHGIGGAPSAAALSEKPSP